jgi:hypothetical protein
MHKSATKCNKTIGKWCKNKHGASKIIDTFETYHRTTDDIRRGSEQMDPHTWTPRPPRYPEVPMPPAPLRHAPRPRLDPQGSMMPPSTVEPRRLATQRSTSRQRPPLPDQVRGSAW